MNTPDGYILKVFRIPGSPQSPPAYGKTVVFIQHGLLCSSADWVVLGKGKAIPYLLADAGTFDLSPIATLIGDVKRMLLTFIKRASRKLYKSFVKA